MSCIPHSNPAPEPGALRATSCRSAPLSPVTPGRSPRPASRKAHVSSGKREQRTSSRWPFSLEPNLGTRCPKHPANPPIPPPLGRRLCPAFCCPTASTTHGPPGTAAHRAGARRVGGTACGTCCGPEQAPGTPRGAPTSCVPCPAQPRARVPAHPGAAPSGRAELTGPQTWAGPTLAVGFPGSPGPADPSGQGRNTGYAVVDAG